MFSKQDQIQGYDDALLAAMNAEEQRQEDHIELIASENYTSQRVMQAQGSGLTNKDADAALGRAHITVNKNAVPNDPQSPFATSGLRIGTPAVTTRGFKVAQCTELAGWICDILDPLGDADIKADVARQVTALCKDFPVYR